MYIQIDDARIFFDTAGPALDADGAERPTLLMLHGGPGYDHSTLRPHFDRFSDDFQVVYLDHRGCGRSTGPQDSWTLDRWADDVAAFCAALGITAPVIFGQSFGGMVAMRVATRHPDLASRLILSSTAAKFELEATVQMARTLGGDVAADTAHALFTAPSLEAYARYAEICLPLYTRNPDAVVSAGAIRRPEVTVHFFANEMKHMDMRADLAAVTVPVLVMAGALDPVTPTLCAREIARAIGANARLEIFDDCGHGAFRDDPEGSERVMRDFLSTGQSTQHATD